MKAIRQCERWRWHVLLLLGATLCASRAIAVPPSDQTVITSLSVVGTNLVVNADIPPGMDQAILEMRPTLDTVWKPTAFMDVSTDGGSVEFAIPKPALEMAFFRLRVTTHAMTNAQLSAELQYVTVPPLGNELPGTDAVFHFSGNVDGSDRILITRKGAFWQHVNWGWPAGAVTINGAQWNPLEKNYLTTTGAVAFLPETYSLEAVNLEIIEGRDVIALERTNQALIVYLDDTPSGPASYEFKIHFHPTVTKPAAAIKSPAATLKIAAQIDGSDSLKITAQGATWQHRAHSHPRAISLNGIPWDVRRTNTLANAGANVFLPTGIDFSTARIVGRKGRDVATMWADAEALWVQFADNLNGSDSYELEISFGQ